MDRFKLEFYEDDAGEFRWRLVSSNGRVVATSGEGYVNRGDCESIADSIFFNKAEPEISVQW